MVALSYHKLHDVMIMRTFGPIQLGSIEIFVKAAETLSFAQAANELGLGAPAVSRSIARLEARLGVPLFARSTRQVRLTDDGRLYLEQCKQALQQISNVEETLSGHRSEPSGLLRMSMPTTYAHHRIIPCLAEFAALYPKIEIELNVSNRNIDFIEEGYDLAIRLGEPADNRLVARKLEDAALGLFTSPAYLKKARAPKTLTELKVHKLIQFELPSSGRPMPWIFKDGGKDIEFNFKSKIAFSDDVLACVNYAKHDGGLFQTYDFIVADDLSNGTLVEVLKSLRGRSRPFSILYPQNRHLSQRVRVFVDFTLKKTAKSR
jgi:DNA-binding transcriptional LysR family regulator